MGATKTFPHNGKVLSRKITSKLKLFQRNLVACGATAKMVYSEKPFRCHIIKHKPNRDRGMKNNLWFALMVVLLKLGKRKVFFASVF